MNSKMYVVLIIIWLMHLPRGKIILFEKFHYIFVLLPNEVGIITYKSETKTECSAKNAKNEQMLKSANILLRLCQTFGVRCSIKKLFLKILQNSHENTDVEVFFYAFLFYKQPSCQGCKVKNG